MLLTDELRCLVALDVHKFRSVDERDWLISTYKIYNNFVLQINLF